MNWKHLFSCILCSLVFAGSAFTQSSASKFPRVSIIGSEVRTLKSANTGRTYDLYVHLPPSTGKKYPVLYVLDGQWDFKLLDSVYGGLLYDKFVPEMVIVGITYSGDSPDYGKLRAMDYTPVPRSDLPGSGDAGKFLAFLKNEVFPFVESNYNGDPAMRMLSGSSFGGLFVLYAMFAEPSLFKGLIASSPAVSYADDHILELEKQYFAKHKELNAKLYLTVGGKEGLAKPVKAFMDGLNERGYKGLNLNAAVMPTEGHSSNKPETYNRGLRFMFND